ncbi:MAG TPA: tetratricopeptide repeat protein [Burkholderiaceae bacterium]|nr:tetratricopeptide repeat protein [Burkholderiaceae bacterium]
MARWWFGWCVTLLLAGCASAPQTPNWRPEVLLHDESFAPLAQAIDASEVFAVDDAMREYVRHGARGLSYQRDRAEWLVKSLYRRGELRLEYDTAITRNAAQAFEARSGNCLSLVLMTAALAKELDLQVEYNSAYTDETWSRNGSLLLRSGHINVTVGRRLIDRGRGVDVDWTVDFLPPGELRGLRLQPLKEATVVAMFMNNRAAEALARDAGNEAYWWARAGLLADPEFTGVVNTLGVIYQRSGRLEAAAQVFNEVLRQQPTHTQALNNLALLYEQQGRPDAAAPLRARLAALEPEPPYHWFALGQQALRRGDARAAREFFAREVKRADYSSEFHFWLAIAHYQLGETEQAQQELERAHALSASHDERDLYAAKLAWLNQQRH